MNYKILHIFATSFPICRNLLSSTEQQCEELKEKQKEMLVKEEELRGEIVFRVSQKRDCITLLVLSSCFGREVSYY